MLYAFDISNKQRFAISLYAFIKHTIVQILTPTQHNNNYIDFKLQSQRKIKIKPMKHYHC